MIGADQLAARLLACCPSFRDDYAAFDCNDLPYAVSGAFAQHLLALYRCGQTAAFPAVARLLEDLHASADAETRELATIGFLEDIQNVWGNNGVDPEAFAAFLLPLSREAWDQLDRFWISGSSAEGAQG